MKYKIVDTFNGGTFGKFNSVKAATRELDKQRRRFRSSLSTANATFCREIAPADAEWFFNHSRNRWQWSATVAPERNESND